MVPFASYVSRGQSKPWLIFSRINGPIVYDKATCGEITYANSLGLISGYVRQEVTFNITAYDTQK